MYSLLTRPAACTKDTQKDAKRHGQQPPQYAFQQQTRLRDGLFCSEWHVATPTSLRSICGSKLDEAGYQLHHASQDQVLKHSWGLNFAMKEQHLSLLLSLPN